MAYQQCINDILCLLKKTYPNKIWNKQSQDKYIILNIVLTKFGSKCLLFDNDILKKTINQIYNGLTISNYIVPLIDIDIEPSLREFNEYDKDYYDCIIEEEENDFKFNLN